MWVVVGTKYSDSDFSAGYGDTMTLGTGKVVAHGGSVREYHNVVIGWDSHHPVPALNSFDQRISTALDLVTNGARRKAASPLIVVPAPTPRLQVPRYDTTGTFPQVLGAGIDLSAVNAGLRDGVLADQRAYAPFARQSARTAGKDCRGIYRTWIDRSLLSASTTVVSAILPAQELSPCGTEGNTWVSITVRVPSGVRVSLPELFSDLPRALPAIAKAWKARVRRVEPEMWPCVKNYPSIYLPRARNYRYFALTTRGLSLGFWDVAACNRLQAVVPYRVLRPYLSTLGATLIAGVRLAQ